MEKNIPRSISVLDLSHETRRHYDANRVALTFILCCAYKEVSTRTLRICHGYCNGLFFVDSEKYLITDDITLKIEEKMKELLKEKITLATIERKVARSYLDLQQQKDKLGILQTWRADPIPVIKLKNHWDFFFRAPQTDAQLLSTFYTIQKYEDGLLMRFPPPYHQTTTIVREFVPMKNYFQSLRSIDEWIHKIGISNISDLNKAVFKGEMDELLWVCESFQEKRVSQVVDTIVYKSQSQKRLIFVAGPSASGKLTIARRIAIQIRATGRKAVVIDMSAYYREPSDLRKNEDGQIDYEQLNAINITLLCKRLVDLLQGKCIPVRNYSYQTQRGQDDQLRTLNLPSNGFLIVVGIHAFNPHFTSQLDESSHKIFASPIIALNLDQTHVMSTSDSRLFRRMLRDYQTRGYSAQETLKRWPMVRSAECRLLFPFQELADFFINTYLLYEMSVLANYCKPLLAEVTDDSLQFELARLLLLTNLFYPLTDEFVPANSVLREFCGHSALLEAPISTPY